jgi:regulation of enolase protein 1 (concanavalin A-like superfamily)
MSGFEALDWLNPPAVAELRGADLRVVTGEGTDFWRETFYGFTRH